MNKLMFDYIVQNRFYDAKVQAAAKTIVFPFGAMLIKTVWREVTPEEESSYHTVTGTTANSI